MGKLTITSITAQIDRNEGISMGQPLFLDHTEIGKVVVAEVKGDIVEVELELTQGGKDFFSGNLGNGLYFQVKSEEETK